MATTIKMPQLSDTMLDGTIINWRKQEGDIIKRGDVIAEVLTDKASTEIESLEDGTLLKILGEIGAKVQVGADICVVGKKGEDFSKSLNSQTDSLPAEQIIGQMSDLNNLTSVSDIVSKEFNTLSQENIKIGEEPDMQPTRNFADIIDNALSDLFKSKALQQAKAVEAEKNRNNSENNNDLKVEQVVQPIELELSQSLETQDKNQTDNPTENAEEEVTPPKKEETALYSEVFKAQPEPELDHDWTNSYFSINGLETGLQCKPDQQQAPAESVVKTETPAEDQTVECQTEEFKIEEFQEELASIKIDTFNECLSTPAPEKQEEEQQVAEPAEEEFIELNENFLRDSEQSWKETNDDSQVINDFLTAENQHSIAELVSSNLSEADVLEKSLKEALESLKKPKAQSPTESQAQADQPDTNLQLDYFTGYAYEDLVQSNELVELEAGGKNSYLEQPLVSSYRNAVVAENFAPAINYFYMTIKVTVDDLLDVVATLRQSGKYHGLSINHLIIKAVALALFRNPGINYCYNNDEQLEFTDKINIGVVTPINGRLLTPVIEDVASLSLAEVSRLALKLNKQVKTGELSDKDLGCATFNVSNVGNSSVENVGMSVDTKFGAMLMQSAIVNEPIAISKDELVVKSVLRLTLSADNKVVSTVTAVRFLNDLKTIIEKPTLILG
ncbi:MAG: 2-oxo acid dehydrogenase subunit E2 [Deltaproteobacteria bacterium]|jgi:pyruvate dehydrogenase E2 component (dihydrolipoamide acetyltransferase)|nr:2-oxo acid dehydrogenase subunit E2 [Deltaproteobacteria bacterium]